MNVRTTNPNGWHSSYRKVQSAPFLSELESHPEKGRLPRRQKTRDRFQRKMKAGSEIRPKQIVSMQIKRDAGKLGFGPASYVGLGQR